MTDWQPIDTAPDDTEVLVYGAWIEGGSFKGVTMAVLSYDGNIWFCEGDHMEEITHWMPLPEPPYPD